MNLQKIQYFVSVAELKNFTLAAETNFISQSALSRHISDLEYELGVKLFNRSKTAVSLTSEGEFLLEYAYDILKKSDNFLDQARALSQSRMGFLRIGYFGYWEGAFVSQAIHDFSVKYPYTDLSFVRAHHGKLNQMIRRGECSMVFTLENPSPADKPIYPNVGWEPIAQSPLYVVVSEESWLASREKVTLKDLENEKQVLLARDYDSIFSAAVTQGFLDEGLVCNYYPHNPGNSLDALLLISANKCINLSTKWIKNMNWPGVKLIPLESSIPPLEFGIAYRLDQQTSLIRSFLSVVRSISAEEFLHVETT